MTSRETIECRIYMAEDAMYRRSGELDRRLHELESRLKDLAAAVHLAVCETGRTPLEVKTRSIVQAVQAFEAGTDLSEISALAERVTSLKGLIESFERELPDSADMRDGQPWDRPRVQTLAAAG